MNQAKLIDYLLGQLSPEQDSELAQLLKSKDIDKHLSELSKQLESVALKIDSVVPSNKLKQSLFAHLEKSGAEKFSGFIPRLSRFFNLSTERIKEILDSVKDVNLPLWDKAMIEGAYLHHFKAGGEISEAHCGLIYLEPGTQITEHEHLGEEKMLVIQGEVTTSDGKTYLPGEVAISDEGTSHTLKAGKDSVCIFAVIANGGVDFKDL